MKYENEICIQKYLQNKCKRKPCMFVFFFFFEILKFGKQISLERKKMREHFKEAKPHILLLAQQTCVSVH